MGCSICFFSIKLFLHFAKKWQILDIPNKRSSHSRVTYRGGGVIFLPLIFYNLIWDFSLDLIWLNFALILISLIGLIDDIIGLSSFLRAISYVLVLALASYNFNVLWDSFPVYYWIVWLIIGTAVINAWNFMDGINGITVLYTGIVILSILFAFHLNGLQQFDYLITSIMIGLFGFSFLNIRKTALAFLGDVGSVLLGIFVVICLTFLILVSNEIGYLLFVLIYGLDSVLTFAERLYKAENVFQAHRTHLYQYLANEKKWPQLRVSFVYACLQCIINVLVIISLINEIEIGLYSTIFIIIFFAIVYLVIKHFIYRDLRFSSTP